MSEEITPQQETSPVTAEWIGSDGAFGNADVLPDSIRDTIVGNGWKSVGDVVDSYSNLRKQFSSGERLPADMTQDEKSALLARISGRPETSDGYDFGDRDIDESFKSKIQEVAYNIGLGSEQVNSLLDLHDEYMTAFTGAYGEQVSQMQEENMSKLRESWGNKKLENVQNGVNKLFDNPELSNIIKSEGFDKNPSFLLLMGKVLDGMGEGNVPVTQNAAPKTRDEVMADIRRNPAFTDRLHPDHEKVIRQFHELYGIR